MEFARVGDFCPNEICPESGKVQSDQQRNIKRAGKTKKGRQRYQCKTRGQTFVETGQTISYRRRTAEEEILETLAFIAEGVRISSLARVKGHKEDTVLDWLRRAFRRSLSVATNGETTPLSHKGAKTMNYQKLLPWMIGFALVAFFLSACSRPQSPTVPTDDPFAYCAAVGTIDAPGTQYTGPPVPEVIIEQLREITETPDDAPADWFVAGTVWRCMDGKVWACFVGANLPCSEKADTSRTPTSEIQDFCKDNPAADIVPAAITGRATVYEWRCTNGEPEIVRQWGQPDAQGFLSDIWYELKPQ